MKSKYLSTKTTVDGIQFDSMKEAKRYKELALLQRAGLISNLQLQVKFELIPTQKINGKIIERPVHYIADFVYMENGEQIVEDVKGYKQGQAYALFTIKRKLMLQKHNIRIREI